MLLPAAWAQNGFTTTIPDEPVTLVVDSDQVFVTGHWVAADKQSEPTGPTVSRISCDKQICRESQANIVLFPDNTFTMTTDYVEYKVETFNSKAIVATSTQGVCGVRTVLKFDLIHKSVYWTMRPSAPSNDLPRVSSKACDSAQMNLELKGETMWRR